MTKRKQFFISYLLALWLTAAVYSFAYIPTSLNCQNGGTVCLVYATFAIPLVAVFTLGLPIILLIKLWNKTGWFI